MKLNEFIQELQSISQNLDSLDSVEVAMADFIPVVKPIYKDGTVFITDIVSE